MTTNMDISNTLAADTQGLAGLKLAAQTNSPQALRAVARQFEAVFTEMMLKSMREATPQDGLFDNDQTRLYTSMLDQQLSQDMANKGIGLADVLMRQLSHTGQVPDGLSGQPSAALPANFHGRVLPSGQHGAGDHVGGNASHQGSHRGNGEQEAPATPVHAFKASMRAHAEAASRATGVPADFMLGQAGLESGWGTREMVSSRGERSHNLFGIKATPDWHGKTIQAVTTEYVHGVAHKKVETFRAYDSYAESFADYANFLRGNPRYQHLLASAQSATAFAKGLQQAGYATDPHYADKLERVIRQAILA